MIRVYDLAGRQVDEAVNTDGQLAGVFADRFPRLGARSRYPSFVKDADAWAFSDDFTVGFRVVEAGRGRKEWHKLWRAELWRLDPGRELLWQRDLPEKLRKVEFARFFEKGGSRYILVAFFSGSNVYVLQQDNGEIDSQFSCGLFSASEFAFEPRRRLLACCDYASRRVRVLSLDAPNNIIFELNEVLSKVVFWMDEKRRRILLMDSILQQPDAGTRIRHERQYAVVAALSSR